MPVHAPVRAPQHARARPPVSRRVARACAACMRSGETQTHAACGRARRPFARTHRACARSAPAKLA
eukprot:2177296-Pleurochrysis_carterae.AAC.1